MIQISNIRFESIIPQKQIKNIQFQLVSDYLQTESKIFKLKSTSILTNEMTLEWTEIFKMPINFDEPIKFQLFTPQQVRLKEQEKESFMFGQFWIKNRGKIATDVFYKQNGKKLKIGTLYINLIIKENQMPLINKIKPEPFSPKIQVSVLVKNLAKVPEKGCIVIDNGKRKLKSPLVSPSTSQKKQFYYLLRFRESFIKDSKKQLVVSFYNEESVFVGKTIFKLIDKQKNMKERLINELLVRVGDIYLNILRKVQLSKDEKQPPTIKNEKKTYDKQLQNTIKKRSGSLQVLSSHFNSQRDSNLTQKELLTEIESKFSYGISKKISNAGFSNDIKQKKYKGAYIGYGNRYDFTDQWKGNPGIGQYNLPSIF